MVKVQQRGLGRGLSALIGDAEPVALKPNAGIAKPITKSFNEDADEQGASGGVLRVAVSKLVANQFQPREHFDEEKLEELTQSIKKSGVMQPIVVRSSKKFKGSFEIIAGERRFRASKRAGLEEVPVIVRELSDSESLEIAIIENIQRHDLNAVEEAQAYQRLLEEFSYTQEELAQAVGKSRPHVANLLRVLTLPEAVKQKIAKGELSLGHAKTLIGHKNAEAIAEEITQRGLNVRQAEKLIKEQQGDVPPRQKAPSAGKPYIHRDNIAKDPDILSLEETLTENLGLVVNINDLGGQKGEIVIAYDTLTQLDSVLRRLGGGV